MLTLKIVSPERIEFTGNVESVKVPGTKGNFEILSGHAPIISTLQKGVVEYDGQHLDILGRSVLKRQDELRAGCPAHDTARCCLCERL